LAGCISPSNPALTLARPMTDTFAGIGPNDVLGFMIAQGAATAAAIAATQWLFAD
jgi:hypothetical protein